MTWLLPICDSMLSGEVLTGAVQLLLKCEAATRQAVAKLGAGTNLPPLVLADSTVLAALNDRSNPEPTTPLIAAWAGGGQIDAQTCARAWHQTSGAMVCDGYLRERLQRVLPGPLPARGSHLAVVDLESLFWLERAVHSEGHRSTARRRVLIELAAQRAILCALLGKVTLSGSAAPPLVGQLHHRLLTQHPEGARLRSMLRWLEGLAGQLSEPRRLELELPFRPWAEVLRAPPKVAPWEHMARLLANAGLQVYGVAQPPPDPPAHGAVPLLDPELGLLLQEAEMGHLPVETDQLGLYIRERSGSPLAPGVHLFCERIEQVGFFENPELLAWAVLWHELAHWRLDDLGAPTSDLTRLQALNIAELFCEVEAHRALEQGKPTWLHTAGSTWPTRSALPLRRWRESEVVLPFSWYPRVLLLRELSETDQWDSFILAIMLALHLADPPYASEAGRDERAVGIADHLLRLLRGEMPLEAAMRWMDAAASQWEGSPRMRALPVVYLWRRS